MTAASEPEIIAVLEAAAERLHAAEQEQTDYDRQWRRLRDALAALDAKVRQ
jgi:uncharacterized lipoprotein